MVVTAGLAGFSGLSFSQDAGAQTLVSPTMAYSPVPSPAMGYAGQPGVYSPVGRQRTPRPRDIPYEDGMPVPPGARIVSRPRFGLFIAGLSVFGTLWLTSSVAGGLVSIFSFSSDNDALWMTLPVAGPFVYLATGDTRLGEVFPVLMGVGQLAGLALTIVGTVSRQRYLRFDQTAVMTPRWSFLPMTTVGAGGALGYGASVGVRF